MVNKNRKGFASFLIIGLVAVVVLLLIVAAKWIYDHNSNVGSGGVQLTPSVTVDRETKNIEKVSNSDDISSIENDLNSTDFSTIDQDVLGVRTAADSL